MPLRASSSEVVAWTVLGQAVVGQVARVAMVPVDSPLRPTNRAPRGRRHSPRSAMQHRQAGAEAARAQHRALRTGGSGRSCGEHTRALRRLTVPMADLAFLGFSGRAFSREISLCACDRRWLQVVGIRWTTGSVRVSRGSAAVGGMLDRADLGDRPEAAVRLQERAVRVRRAPARLPVPALQREVLSWSPYRSSSSIVEVVFLYPWAVVFKELGWFGYVSMSIFLVADWAWASPTSG